MFRRETLEEHPLSDARINDPRVLSAATAIPSHRVKQQDTKEFARRPFVGKLRDLDPPLLSAAGVVRAGVAVLRPECPICGARPEAIGEGHSFGTSSVERISTST